jgi:hypothetical protein
VFTSPLRKSRVPGGAVPYRRDVTVLCSGVRFVARLLEGRAPGRGREATVVRHHDTGNAWRFDTEREARRYLQRYCCEPSAFELAYADDGESAFRAA